MCHNKSILPGNREPRHCCKTSPVQGIRNPVQREEGAGRLPRKLSGPRALSLGHACTKFALLWFPGKGISEFRQFFTGTVFCDWFAEQREFLSVFLFFNRVTSDVSSRVPPILRPQHLEFQYFARHLQYCSKTATVRFRK
jgi:hypothetical protein